MPDLEDFVLLVEVVGALVAVVFTLWLVDCFVDAFVTTGLTFLVVCLVGVTFFVV